MRKIRRERVKFPSYIFICIFIIFISIYCIGGANCDSNPQQCIKLTITCQDARPFSVRYCDHCAQSQIEGKIDPSSQWKNTIHSRIKDASIIPDMETVEDSDGVIRPKSLQKFDNFQVVEPKIELSIKNFNTGDLVRREYLDPGKTNYMITGLEPGLYEINADTVMQIDKIDTWIAPLSGESSPPAPPLGGIDENGVWECYGIHRAYVSYLYNYDLVSEGTYDPSPIDRYGPFYSYDLYKIYTYNISSRTITYVDEGEEDRAYIWLLNDPEELQKMVKSDENKKIINRGSVDTTDFVVNTVENTAVESAGSFLSSAGIKISSDALGLGYNVVKFGVDPSYSAADFATSTAAGVLVSVVVVGAGGGAGTVAFCVLAESFVETIGEEIIDGLFVKRPIRGHIREAQSEDIYIKYECVEGGLCDVTIINMGLPLYNVGLYNFVPVTPDHLSEIGRFGTDPREVIVSLPMISRTSIAERASCIPSGASAVFKNIRLDELKGSTIMFDVEVISGYKNVKDFECKLDDLKKLGTSSLKTIKGTVKEPNGMPIEGAFVRIEVDGLEKSDMTSYLGQFQISNIDPKIGTEYYVLEVSKNGYKTAISKVRSGGDLEIILEPLSLDIISPKKPNPVFVGDPDNPSSGFEAKLSTGFPLPEPLSNDIFSAKIGNKPAIVKLIPIPLENSNGYYTLNITPPIQDEEGLYDLNISFSYNEASVSDTEQKAVIYSMLPYASFAYTPERPIVGMEVAFNASDYISSEDDNVLFKWDFGDGCIETGANANHIYTSAGYYKVKLNVTYLDRYPPTKYGERELIVSDNILYIEYPKRFTPSFIGNPSNPSQFEARISTEIPLSEPIDDDVFAAMIGDKIAAVELVPISYIENFKAFYTLNITPPVQDIGGSYDFNVSFKQNGKSAYCTEQKAVIYSEPLIAPFVYYPEEPVVTEPVTFDASGFFDPEDENISYMWDFGDGNFTTGSKVVHAYAIPGNYKLKLVVTYKDSSKPSRVTEAELTVISNKLEILAPLWINPVFVGDPNNPLEFEARVSTVIPLSEPIEDDVFTATIGDKPASVKLIPKSVLQDFKSIYTLEITAPVQNIGGYYDLNISFNQDGVLAYDIAQNAVNYSSLNSDEFGIKFDSAKNVYHSDETAEIMLNVTNNRDQDTEIWLGVSFKDPLGEVEKYDSQIIVAPQSAQIAPGETKTFTAEWQVPDDAPQGQYEIAVNCWKDETLEEKYTDNIEWVPVFSITPSFEFVPMDLCMVLDKSGSMDGTMGYGTRLDCAKAAAKDLTNILLPQDCVAVVSFSGTATTEIGLTSDLDAVKREIDGIYSGGGTSFGAGLREALRTFDAGGDQDHVPVIVLLSDGEQSTSPPHDYYSSQCYNRGIPIFTVGFASSESEVDVANLGEMSDKTDGKYYFADNMFDLESAFLEIHLNTSGWSPNVTHSGSIAQNESIILPLANVSEDSGPIRGVIYYPGSNLDMILIDPNGNEVPLDSPNVIYSGDTNPESIIIIDPIPGIWSVKIIGKDVDGSEEFRLIFSEYNPPEPPIPPFGQNITINENSGQNLGDYQVLIELNFSDFPNKAAKNGTDVRFLDKDRNKLNYWIKEWNDASKTAEIWVKVPYIPANGETEIEMRYGCQNAESQSDGNATFELFDGFDDGSIDSKKWIANSSSSEFVIEKDGELQIRANALTKADADLISRSAYGPNVAMKFRANISEGHWLDHKGAGFLSANVGDDFNEVGDSVYLRGEESRLYTLNRYPSPTSESLCTGAELIEQDYEEGYQTWEIRWLDSEIDYYINDVLKATHTTEGSSVKIAPRFSINTYTAEPVDPAEISVDWIFVRKCASSEPTVQIEAAESAGE